MNDNSFGIREAKATINQSELDGIMQGHIDSGQFNKEQLAQIRKREANKIKEAKVVAEKPKAKEVKEVEVEEVKPTKPNPRTKISTSGSSPSDILGANNLSFFNKSEESGVKDLREMYGDDFVFEEKLFQDSTEDGGGGGFDAITVSTKDGKKSATFDMNIGGSTFSPNLYGTSKFRKGEEVSYEEGRNRSYDTLTNFIKENSTQEGLDSQATKKASRKELLKEINTERDIAAEADIAEIEEMYENEELFTEKTVKMMMFGEDMGERKKVSYEKELKRAKQELSLDGGNPTKEEIQMLAKSFIIDKIQEEKLTSIMNKTDFIQRNDYLGINKKEGVQERYNLAAREFDIDFKKEMALYDLKRTDLETGGDITRYEEINSQFSDGNHEYEIKEGENYFELENGKKVPEKIINEYKRLQPAVTAKVASINKLSESIQEKAAGYGDNAAAIDISRRNYNAWEEFLVETSMGLYEIGLNVKTGVPLLLGGENKKLIERTARVKAKLQETRDSYSKDVEFEDAFSSIWNFADFAAQEVSNQIPIFAALAIPYVGTSIIGVSAFGDHYVNLNMERDTPGGRQKSNADIWWSSVGFGASELVFERLTTIPLLRAAKRGFSSTPGSKMLQVLTDGQYFKKHIGKLAYGALSEPIGEGMTQLTQNWIDGKPMTQGLGHAMFSGLMFGTTLSIAPFARGAYLNKYNDHASKAEARKRVNKMRKLGFTNNKIDEKIKELKEYGVDGREKAIVDLKKNKKINEKIIAQLYEQNVAEMKELEIAVQGISSDVTKMFFGLEQQQEALKLEAQEIENNKTLTIPQRNDQLKVVQARFDAIGHQMEAFKDKKAFGDEYTAFKGLEENAVRVAELEKRAKSKLFDEGKKDPTAIQINDKAKFLYNVDKINADYKANSRAGLTSVINAQTREEAIEKVNSFTNVDDKVKKEVIKGIQDGNHGVNIPTIDGKNLPMQVVESMAADDRLETRTHEVGHSVFIKAISQNSKAFDGLADQILEHLKTTNPSAYKRVLFRLNNQTASDEVIMLFLEEVASNKVDVKKSGKAGFFATLMNKGIEEVGGKPIDLKGETDAINFLVGIAKKIKDGTISNEDIANIKANKIAVDAAAMAPKAPVETKAKASAAIDTRSLEELVKIIKRGGNPKKVKEAEDALAPQFELLALSEKALNYDTRKGDIAREDVVAEAMTYLPGIIERFDPTGINPKTGKPFKFSTFVIANMKPKQQVIYEKVKPLTYGETTSIDTKEARQIEDTSGKTTNTEKTFVQKINILQDFAIANRVADKIKALVKVVKGDNFKSIISKYAGKVGELIFEVPANKIMEGGANLAAVTKYTEGMPAPAEAQNIQRFFNAPENADKFIKTLPLYNVTDKTADINKIGENIEVSRDTYGYAIGLKGLPLDYFYESYTDPKALSEDPKVYEQRVTSKAGRSMGLTSQTPMKRLKPQFRKPTSETVERFKKDLGITPKNEPNVYSRDIGQLLKGVAKVHSINAAISGAQRFQEAKLKTAPVTEQKGVKQQTADITAAQSKIAFSAAVKTVDIDVLNEGVVEQEFEMDDITHIDKLLNINGQEGIFRHRDKTEIDEWFYRFEYDIIANVPESVLPKSRLNTILRPSRRIFPGKKFGLEGKGKDMISVDGKQITIDAYYDFKRKELLKKDLKYGKPFKAEGAKYVYGRTYGDIFGKTEAQIEKSFSDGTVEAQNKINLSMHKQLWERINKSVKDTGGDSLRAWGSWLSMVGQDTEHPHRMGAELLGYSKNPKGVINKKGKVKLYEWEHAMPATRAYLYLLHNSADKNLDFQTSYGLVSNNFKLIALDSAEDLKLKAAGRTTSMGKDWSIILDSWLDRYFEGDIGIDARTIFGFNNKTFEKIYNIPRLKPNLKKNQILSGAINFSRSTNNPTKGITVLDFDDTLATTKSGVRANIPNTDGLPKPGRKVIFLAGGAGSGKGNVISKLGLKDQGFKVVNSDISLEWLKKNSGLPENMNDFTKEQRSKLGSLQHQARGIAKRKMMKYQGEGGGVVVDGTGGSIKSMENLVNEFKAKGYDVSMVFTETSLDVALERNAARKERSLLDKIVEKNHEAVQGNKDGFKTMFGDRFMEVNTDNLSQKDAMPSKLTNKMNDFVSGYENRRLDAEEFARDGASILEQGGTFDFSEFNEVVEGQTAPLFEKAMKLQGKFGNKDMFVLTARPAESADAIHAFLEANGLNIPLKNITGLANSTAESKALWMAEKVGEGYNDFYFADDALQNVEAVQNMLNQFDVKSKVQQAKADFVKGDSQVVKLLEESSMNDVKDVDRLTKPGTYDNIKFSKAHRAEYENTISKNRPDLVKSKLVSKTVDRMFDYIDSLDVPADKRRKYEKITTKWLATSNVKLGEDGYKIQQAVELAEKYNKDIFSYNNPNEIIEAYAGKSKAKPTNPKNVKEFGEGRVFNKKHGITVHEVEDTKEGMMSVRKVADTHWGPKSNPWCIIARSEKPVIEPRQYGYESVATKSEAQARKQQLESEGFIVEITTHVKNYKGKYPGKFIDGKRVDMRYELDIKEVTEGPGVMEDAWQNWTVYGKSKKYIVFQNGRLSSFYADDQYWDRMDSPTDAPVIQIKEGNVTSKVELVPIGDGNVDEFVMETRTTSKDKKTVTTEVLHETQDGYEVGTKIIENRVNGITVKSTRSRPGFDRQGNDVMHTQEIINFDKSGKATNNVTFNSEGLARAINRYGMPFGEMSIRDIVQKKGDLLSHEINDGDISYYYGDVLINGQKTQIGWGMPSNLDLRDFVKTSPNGEVRADIKKILEVDPNTKGLPKGDIKFSKGMNQNFNDILEGSTGVGSIKEFSDAQARLRGQKTKYKSIIPASAQDFQGLLYSFLGKGKQGEKDMAFFKKALIDPFARGINELNASRQSAANDFENLNKRFPEVKKELNKSIEGLDYTYDQAMRVYLWNKAGFEVPGLSMRDLAALTSVIENNPEMKAYADTIGLISKKDAGYSKPKDYWLAESIASDLLSDGAIGDLRSDLLAEWIENKNIIFSKENLNKIEAIYGSNFREALEDMLYRMETGRNRPTGGSRLVNGYMNWVNNSVGAIMFINLRSATLQTISATNYLNWTDNNPAKAAAAFANQPQFWSDFSMIWNSPYLKQRRSGNQRGINEAELSEAIAGSDNKAKAALAWLLKKGFTPTQLADSFAISMGGATFLRNRINKYVKEGMSQGDAEAKAWIDFQETTEVNQQSARPDMISQQQASPLGRLILAFQNTPMQYARIMNKATRDLANGRGDYKTHISKIAYYGFVQSIIFGALQSALYASLGDDDEEDFDKKKERILNQMVDSWLSGIGVGGKAIGTVKNTIMEYFEQRDKGWNADHAYTLLTILSFSPPIGSKLRKIYSSIKTEEFNRGVFEKRGFSLDNPIWSGIGNVIEGVTNAPLGRMANLMLQLDNAMDSSHAWWQRVALILGQNTWDLGIKDPDIEAAKSDVKKDVKKKKETSKDIKKETINKNKQAQEKKDGKKDIKCAAVSKSGSRCKTKIEPGSSYCTIHAKVKSRKDGKKVQCKKVKSDKKRCGMQTSSASGYCYYHD